jgi:hypothetical protein
LLRCDWTRGVLRVESTSRDGDDEDCWKVHLVASA